jgi:hypothetical protein
MGELCSNSMRNRLTGKLTSEGMTMIRPFLILALATYFTSNSLSAPKLIDKTPIPSYLPSTEGAKLVYTSHSRDGTSTQTDLVKTVEQKDKSLIVTIERSNNKDETKNTL